VGREPLGDEREAALRRQLLTGVGERTVQLVDAPAQHRVGERRPVHGAPGERGAVQGGVVEVDDALAEPAGHGRAPVVRDVRRQQRHRRRQRAVLVAVEVVSDGAVVDDQQGPGVVGVRRVGVLGEPGVEHLGDPRDRRAPGADVLGRASHARNVQDRRGVLR
jgi:hypothetical protein